MEACLRCVEAEPRRLIKSPHNGKAELFRSVLRPSRSSQRSRRKNKPAIDPLHLEGPMAGSGKTCLRVLAKCLATAHRPTVPPRRERTVIIIAMAAVVLNHLLLVIIAVDRIKSIRTRPARQDPQSAFPGQSIEFVCRMQ